MVASSKSLTQLRWRWLGVAVLYCLALYGGYSLLTVYWHAVYVERWVAWAAVALIAQLGLLWWGLQHNHAQGEERLLPSLGYGNGLTLTRGLAICLLAGFLFAPRPQSLLAWVPAALYTFSSIIDFLDGYVARLTRQTTVLGEILDMEFDGLAMLVAIGLGVQYGQLPWWYLVLGLGRQLFIGGLWLRKRLRKPVYDMTPSDTRRLIAGFQMGFMTVVLWPVFEPPETTLASFLFGGFLAGSFLRDWLVVSGVFRPASARYQRARRVAKALLEEWLPVVARTVGAMVAFVLIFQALPDLATWRDYLNTAEPAIVRGLLTGLGLLSPLAALLFAGGVLARTTAVMLVGLACLDLLARGFAMPTNGLLLVCTIWVAQLGGGRWALWPVEETLLRRQAGE